ncbi:3-deoxy-manno-octulosonate cytidylyltransferase [Marinobacteraceae bacterium S3BR75-40.1]
MAFTVIIPARYASTRLPGKPLLEIAGKPMIQHVFERASESDAGEVVVATDNQSIMDTVESFGARALMTREDHASGTDRLEEVVTQLGMPHDAIVVNVQGDEPLIPPALINQVARNLEAHPEASIATLCDTISDIEAVFNPNVVKVVFDQKGMAHYFSRAPIPWARDAFADGQPQALPEGTAYYRHIGIYAYRVGFLKEYVTWSASPLESAESLEQLRALWKGHAIHVDITRETPPAGVDTQADLERVRAHLEASHG